MGSEFDFDSEEDTSLIDDALDEELEEEQDKNIKIAIVGRQTSVNRH